MESLQNKTAVITGGTRGLGLAAAQAFVQAGAAVVVASRSPESVQRAVRLLQAAGGQASGIPCDVSDPVQVQALAGHAVAHFGRFHIWVNNAGISAPYGPTLQVDPETFIQVLRTNIFGTYYGSITALRHFLPHHDGKLINILGRGDKGPVPLQNAYASSKTWMRSFTLALAKEHKEPGIGIFAYNPGLMDTELMQQVEVIAGHEGDLKPLSTVMRLWANPPQVPAQKIVWLASSATDGKTGLAVNELSPSRMLGGLLREALRRVRGQSAQPRKFDVSSIPPQDL